MWNFAIKCLGTYLIYIAMGGNLGLAFLFQIAWEPGVFMIPTASINGYMVHSFKAMLCILCNKEGSIIFSVNLWSILEHPGEILMDS